jgi:hypothetical protein
MKQKCIQDIDNFLKKPFLNQKKFNDILTGELKQSLQQVKNFLTKNLHNVKYTKEFLKRMEILDRLRKQKLLDVLPEFKQIGG